MRHAILLTLLLAMGGGACAYRFAGSEQLYPEDISTVAIPTVTNATAERGDTAQLTTALVRALEARTPYRVARAEKADTLLEVKISDIRRRTTSRDTVTALPDEQLYVVLADIVWKDLRTGEVLVRLENFEQTAALYPTLGESDFLSSQDAAEQLAIGIVEALGADW